MPTIPANLLAVDDDGASSEEIAVEAGAPVTVALKNYVNTARVAIELKDDAGDFNRIGELTAMEPSRALASPGNYRLTRIAGGVCGAFRA